MKILKFCLLPFIFFATVPLYGNPKELVYAWYAAREIEWHMWQHDGSKYLEGLFKKLSCGETVTTEDVQSLFPKECYVEGIKLKSADKKDLFTLMRKNRSEEVFDKHSVPWKGHDCVLIFRHSPYVMPEERRHRRLMLEMQNRRRTLLFDR